MERHRPRLSGTAPWGDNLGRAAAVAAFDAISRRDAVFCRTLEVRWICRGDLPAGIIRWLGPFTAQIEQREDRYLVEPWLPDLSLKIRGGSRLDIKVLLAGRGDLPLAGGSRGHLELWEKRTFPLESGAAPPAGAPGWLRVRKLRRRRFFTLAGSRVIEEVPGDGDGPPGCSVELTTVLIGSDVWWTLGLEAAGPSDQLRMNLHLTAASLFRDPVPDGLRLGLTDSVSYVRWLGSQRRPGASSPRPAASHLARAAIAPPRDDDIQPAVSKRSAANEDFCSGRSALPEPWLR